MPQYGFGPGSLYGIPSAAGATPFRFGAIQEFTLDVSATVKELFGQNQFALLAQRGTMKVTGKAKNAQITASLFNAIFFGQTSVTGVTNVSTDETGTVPATTTYTIQVANHTAFVADLGVTYSNTGVALTKVASLAAIGQYTVDRTTGTYTFYSADALAAVKLNYSYTAVTGENVAVYNQLLGTTPTFQLVFDQTTDGKQITITFPKVTATKFAFGTKLEDFVIPEFDVSMFCDASGQIMTINTAE